MTGIEAKEEQGEGRTRRRIGTSNIGGVNVAIKAAAAAVAVAVLGTGPARNLLCYVVCT